MIKVDKYISNENIVTKFLILYHVYYPLSAQKAHRIHDSLFRSA